MIAYLSSPSGTLKAHAVRGMPVLLSFATWEKPVGEYVNSFSRLLLDSGAYSAHASGITIDLDAYAEWSAQWPWADAIAGLDHIGGDWRQSLKNYERLGFPTFHDSDPPELLADLIPIARARRGWLGIGLCPPRHGKRGWLMESLARVPDDLHVHGWALGGYADLARLDSIDSTNWFRDAGKLRLALPWLTPAECLDLVVLRYRRRQRPGVRETAAAQMALPAVIDGCLGMP